MSSRPLWVWVVGLLVGLRAVLVPWAFVGALGAQQVSNPSSGQDTESRIEERLRRMRFDDSLFVVQAIERPLKVAEWNEIPVVIKERGVVTVFCGESIGEAASPEEEHKLGVLHRADGSSYVKVRPMRLGKLELELTASFSRTADPRDTLALARAKVEVQVEPSGVAPYALRIGGPGGTEPPWVYIDLSKPHEHEFLYPEAVYPDIWQAVPIAGYASFKVSTADGQPVIEVDQATGRMTPLRVGDALVETRYDGAVRRTCVQVRNEPYRGDISDCKELRRLEEIAAAAPLNATWTTDPGDLLGIGTGRFVPERMRVTAPDHRVGLGQPVEIPVKFSGGKVARISFNQWIFNGSGIGVPAVVQDREGAILGGGKAKIVRDDGDEKTIRIVPLALGELEVQVEAYFEDGGIARRFFILRVEPSSKGLVKLDELAGLQTTLALEGEPGLHQLHLHAELTYEDIHYNLRVWDMVGTKFTVEQPAEAPVVSVDEHGLVKALRKGSAVIVTDFDGVQYRYPIEVK